MLNDGYASNKPAEVEKAVDFDTFDALPRPLISMAHGIAKRHYGWAKLPLICNRFPQAQEVQEKPSREKLPWLLSLARVAPLDYYVAMYPILHDPDLQEIISIMLRIRGSAASENAYSNCHHSATTVIPVSSVPCAGVSISQLRLQVHVYCALTVATWTNRARRVLSKLSHNILHP